MRCRWGSTPSPKANATASGGAGTARSPTRPCLPWVSGPGVSALVVQFGKPAIIATLFVCLGLALRGLAGELAKEKGWLAVSAVAAVLSALTWQSYPTEAGSTGLGVAVALGCATHCLGDAITKEGVPFLAPFLTLGKERWWEFRLPSFLSIRAGGPFEKVVLGPALTVAVGLMVIWAIDGAPQAIYDAFMPAPAVTQAASMFSRSSRTIIAPVGPSARNQVSSLTGTALPSFTACI